MSRRKWQRAQDSARLRNGLMTSGPSRKTFGLWSNGSLGMVEKICWSDRKNNRSSGQSDGFNTPDNSRRQDFLCAQPPARQNLRALIYAFESFFGFRNCFDRRDPEIFRSRRVQSDSQFLPAVLQVKNRPG